MPYITSRGVRRTLLNAILPVTLAAAALPGAANAATPPAGSAQIQSTTADSAGQVDAVRRSTRLAFRGKPAGF